MYVLHELNSTTDVKDSLVWYWSVSEYRKA